MHPKIKQKAGEYTKKIIKIVIQKYTSLNKTKEPYFK